VSTADAATALDALVADGVRLVTLGEFSTTWAVQRPRFAWLLGAGGSASAGVPLASSIRDRLLFDRYAAVHQLVRQDLDETDPALVERVHTFFDDANGMPPLGSSGDYSAAFELCLPESSAPKALLQNLIDGAKPGFAQRVFGGLIVSGACDLVITTNFDRLVEKSVAEAHRAGTDLNQDLGRELNVAGLDSTARATTALQNHQWPLVLNLHGDFREKRLMNTDDELRTQEDALRRFVVDAGRQFGLVVSGYSGRDESVMDMLTEAATVPDGWPHGIWWLTRPRRDPCTQRQDPATSRGSEQRVDGARRRTQLRRNDDRALTTGDSGRCDARVLQPSAPEATVCARSTSYEQAKLAGPSFQCPSASGGVGHGDSRRHPERLASRRGEEGV
jgi:hypothetical protein